MCRQKKETQSEEAGPRRGEEGTEAAHGWRFRFSMLTGLRSLSLSPFTHPPPGASSFVVSSYCSSSSSLLLLPCCHHHVPPVACLAPVGVCGLRTLACGWPCGSAGFGSPLCRHHSDRGLAAGSTVAKAVDYHRSDAVVEASSPSPSSFSSSSSSSMCVRSSSSSSSSARNSLSFSALVDDQAAFGLLSATHAGSCVGHPSQAAAPLMAQMPSDKDVEPQFPDELDRSLLPKHVAIIMDGNSRWAERRGWPASMGHEAGVQALKEVVKLAHLWGIKVLTVFAFSTENWLRPKMEVDFLMCLFEKVLGDELNSIAKENVRVHCMGDLTLLPDSLKNVVARLDEHTQHNTGLKFCIALSYSGRHDITSACQRLAARVEAGEMSSSEVTEAAIAEELKTSWLGEAQDPDLLIRTSGEQRLSNFMLWQTAYTELHFVDSLWPDFGEVQFKEALLAYQNRKRRFGRRK